MRPTKIDPVDYARAIVHDCLASEFGRMTRAPLPGPARNDGPAWNANDIALVIAGILSAVAVAVWALTR